MGDACNATAESEDSATEQTPLVARRPSGRPRLRPKLSVASLTAKNRNVIILLLCLALFVAASATGFTLMPLTRIVEDILCRQHFGLTDEPLDEEECKGDDIQSKLAIIIAVTGAIEAIMGCIGAIPWSVMLDKIGRKPVLILALTGLALNLMCAMTILWFWTVFPLQLVWISGLFQLLGGGQAIVAGGVLSILSDVASEKDRATVFLRMHIASLFGNLISPALASLMMSQTGPWPCLLVAIGCLIAGGMVFIIVPEAPQHESNKQSGERGGLDIATQLREALSMLNSFALILLFAVALTTSPVTLSTLAFLVQFVSKRYEIPIFATGYVQTGYGVANMIFALGIVPYISSLALTNERLKRILRVSNERRRDLALAKWSFGFLIVSAIVLGLAPNLAVFCLGLFFMAAGAGYSSFTRSLISFQIKAELRSRAFALVGMVEVLGNIYSQPMLAGLFSLGLDLGGEWVGLPYLFLALLMAFSLLLLHLVRVSDLEEEAVRPGSRGDVETQT